jgi:hypothetical protein
LIIERLRISERLRATAGLNATPLVAMLMSIPSASSARSIGRHCGLGSASPYPATITHRQRRATASTSSKTASNIGPGAALDDDVFVVSGHMRQRRLHRLVNST